MKITLPQKIQHPSASTPGFNSQTGQDFKPPFKQDVSLSPYPTSRILNSLWRQLHVKSSNPFIETMKPPLLLGLALLKRGFHEHFFSNKARQLSILITAGGTREPLDDVRYLTNFSSGALGRCFANIAAWRGHQVTLLAPASIAKQAGILHPNIRHFEFTSTQSLQEQLQKFSAEKNWDLILHSAAVSDFTPADPAKGKIASKDHDELTIRLKKTPKLLASFRQWFPNSLIVGFKLLSGKTDEERLGIAREQLAKYGTDFCFENDLTRVSRSSHEARLVVANGDAFPIPADSKFDVATATLNFLELKAAQHRTDTK